MTKTAMIKTTKFTLGVVGAIYIAKYLQMDFVFSAGIIAILSILETRKKSIEAAAKRIVASILGLTLVSIVFFMIGFNLFGLAVFLIVYIPLVLRWRIQEGLVTNIVLSTHLLAYGSLDSYIIFNEVKLLAIGIIMGLIINIHMPNQEKSIKEQQKNIEKALKEVLMAYSYELRNACTLIYEDSEPIENLKNEIEKGHILAYQFFENNIFESNRHYIDYIEMRKGQLVILEAMKRKISGLILTQSVASGVSQYTEEVAGKISTYNTGEELLEKLKELLNSYRQQELPKSRQEFEDRAKLFIFLNELEQLIRLKTTFVRNYSKIYY